MNSDEAAVIRLIAKAIEAVNYPSNHHFNLYTTEMVFADAAYRELVKQGYLRQVDMCKCNPPMCFCSPADVKRRRGV